MMSAAAVRLIRCGGVTQTLGCRGLTVMGCWAPGGVSETAVGRGSRQAMQIGLGKTVDRALLTKELCVYVRV